MHCVFLLYGLMVNLAELIMFLKLFTTTGISNLWLLGACLPVSLLICVLDASQRCLFSFYSSMLLLLVLF